MDPINNVCGIRQGESSSKKVMISAHLDTVFPDSTDLTIKCETDRIATPGLGDNALVVATLLTIQNFLNDNHITFPFDVCFVANSCEEGLGDLQGIKKALELFDNKPVLKSVLSKGELP